MRLSGNRHESSNLSVSAKNACKHCVYRHLYYTYSLSEWNLVRVRRKKDRIRNGQVHFLTLIWHAVKYDLFFLLKIFKKNQSVGHHIEPENIRHIFEDRILLWNSCIDCFDVFSRFKGKSEKGSCN